MLGFSLPDCRAIVKTLVCGMKTITWGAGSCRLPGSTVDYGTIIGEEEREEEGWRKERVKGGKRDGGGGKSRGREEAYTCKGEESG